MGVACLPAPLPQLEDGRKGVFFALYQLIKISLSTSRVAGGLWTAGRKLQGGLPAGKGEGVPGGPPSTAPPSDQALGFNPCQSAGGTRSLSSLAEEDGQRPESKAFVLVVSCMVAEDVPPG